MLLEDSIKALTNFNEILDDKLRDFSFNNCCKFDNLQEVSRENVRVA